MKDLEETLQRLSSIEAELEKEREKYEALLKQLLDCLNISQE